LTNRKRLEAGGTDEKANIFKVQYLYGSSACRCDRHKREGRSAIPGETSNIPEKVLPSGGGKMVFEESAEVIEAGPTARKGPNLH